jgi:hypothetical protein
MPRICGLRYNGGEPVFSASTFPEPKIRHGNVNVHITELQIHNPFMVHNP